MGIFALLGDSWLDAKRHQFLGIRNDDKFECKTKKPAVGDSSANELQTRSGKKTAKSMN